MNVLFIAAEADPFAKTGGLGDVVGSLPAALRKLGIDARVLIPHYGTIDGQKYGLTYAFQYKQQRALGMADVFISKTVHHDVPVYFLRSWPFFGEPYIYTDNNWDNQRFTFFAQAAMGAIWQLANGADGKQWWPDVIHVHDWHTGLIPFLLHTTRFVEGWNKIASVISIHNMAYQGAMAGSTLDGLGLPPRDHWALNLMNAGGDLLAIGLAYADKLNTVSPHHAFELHYPRFGEGLDPLIWIRDADFSGILNGLDMERYNPATDPHIFQKYDTNNFRTERIKNKRDLQQLVGLPVHDDVPVIGLVSRLVEQKGIDLAIDALRWLSLDTDVQIIALGSGEDSLEYALWKLSNDFHWKVRAYTYFDPILAQRIYAGSDFLLMPSRYEPCGTSQMISMRYGCLPVVRETGGLKDTVVNYDGGPADTGNGFTFSWETPEAIVGTLRWALGTYYSNHPAIDRMQARGMAIDWGWDKSAHQYIDLYENAIRKKRSWVANS